MALEFDRLFDPLSIRGLRIANRIVMSPMTRRFSPDGVPDESVAAYYRRRVEGGTGLIITEGTGVDHPAALGVSHPQDKDVPRLYGAAAMQGWRGVVEQVHAAGGKIIPQLWHHGVMHVPVTGLSSVHPTCQPSGIWGPRDRLTAFSPSDIAKYTDTSEPMSEREILDVIAAFGRSAANAKAAGFDGIAIHGGHGYMVDNFLWEGTNQRNDDWGGDIARRSRFPVEIVKAIRAEVGEDLPIVFRFSQWKQQDFKARLASDPHELEAILTPLAEAGVDVFDASVRYFDRAEFEGSDLNLAGWAKKLTGKLSMTVGGVGLSYGRYDRPATSSATSRTKDENGNTNLDLLMRRYDRGEFDLVAVGRSLLADAAWPNKQRLGKDVVSFTEDALKTLS